MAIGLTKKVGNEKATSRHSTQKQAENEARGMIKKDGGGELITKGEDGKIRSKDTIPPAKDPNPPKNETHSVLPMMSLAD